MRMVLTPRVFSASKARFTLGLRMSRSKMMTFCPDKAMIPPRFTVTKVLPSPEMVDVTEISRFFLAELMKSRLVRMERMDSEMADLGFLSTTRRDTSIFSLS